MRTPSKKKENAVEALLLAAASRYIIYVKRIGETEFCIIMFTVTHSFLVFVKTRLWHTFLEKPSIPPNITILNLRRIKYIHIFLRREWQRTKKTRKYMEC